MIDLKQFAKLLEEDEEGRGRIAEILASEIALRNRRLIIEAVLREVATKQDLKELKAEIKEYVDLRFQAFEEKFDQRLSSMEEKFNERMNSMEERFYAEHKSMEEKFNERFSSLEKRFELLTRFTVATFVGIMLTLVSVVLTRVL